MDVGNCIPYNMAQYEIQLSFDNHQNLINQIELLDQSQSFPKVNFRFISYRTFLFKNIYNLYEEYCVFS